MVYREKGGTGNLVRGEKGVIGEYLGARQEGPRGVKEEYCITWLDGGNLGRRGCSHGCT